MTDMPPIITPEALSIRKKWISEIHHTSGNFLTDSSRFLNALGAELANTGGEGLRNHLRLCGAIPEVYAHDSSEEKLYSKYTDTLTSVAFSILGIRSLVLSERGDAADVECFCDDYEFVADAKAFRLSRTAKNAKDFKIPSMHKWKFHRKYAMLICPLYQLPASSSQIYRQAITEDVCIFSFSHLALLTAYAEHASAERARQLLSKIFQVSATLNPSKEADVYWRAINISMLAFDAVISKLWRTEKLLAAVEAVEDAKQEGLAALSAERSRYLSMSHQEAINALVKLRKLDAREATIRSVKDNGLMELV